MASKARSSSAKEGRSVNVRGLTPENFKNLIKIETGGKELGRGNKFEAKLKDLDENEKKSLYDYIANFKKYNKIEEVPKRATGVLRSKFEVAKSYINDNILKDMLQPPTVEELEEMSKPKQIQFGKPQKEAPLQDFQAAVGDPIMCPLSEPLEEVLKKYTKKANPLASESEQPIEGRLDKGSDNNPSVNGRPEQKPDLNADSSGMAYSNPNMPAQPIVSPDLLQQSEKEQNDRLNVVSSSAGIPSSDITRQFGKTAEQTKKEEPEFEKNARENEAFKSGGVILDANNDISQLSGKTKPSEIKPKQIEPPKQIEQLEMKEDRGKASISMEQWAKEKARIDAFIQKQEQMDAEQKEQARRRLYEVRMAEMAKQFRNERVTKAYNPAELAILKAEQENQLTQERAQQQADKEQNKTIGYRENTGLQTMVSRAGADIQVKSQEEIEKSIHTFANFSWIPLGARNDSKLGINSSLQKMWDITNEMRYTDTFNPHVKEQKTSCEIFEENRDLIRGITDNRYVPMTKYEEEFDPVLLAQKIEFSKRPPMAIPPSLNSVGDYNYFDPFMRIVGTTNLGLCSMTKVGNREDYDGDTVHFPDTIIQHDGVVKYV